MAQLTPKDILEISEPIEEIYQRTVDELLINIAHHFNITGWERTRYWEIKKLSELGALTKESVEIITKNTGRLPEEIERAFLQVSEKACLDIDPQLRAAAEKGILQDPGTSATTSPEIRRMVNAYSAQAVDKMNMTNTTMLESTRQAYVHAVQQVVNEEELAEARKILETQSFAVTTGAETRTRAIRHAMDDLSKTGLAGFYDRAGRAWSPEAYAAMVVRTTSHNAAIEAIRTRQQEFGGGDVFQISVHTGARPLCAPYQGGIYSWSGSGVFVDGNGKEHTYEPISATSYGEAAGIFGINCGHHPIPLVSGFSYLQEGPTQTPEENAREYEESQKQRQYERDIREAKRALKMVEASNTADPSVIKEAKQKVAQAQAHMRAFIDQTGRARRYDREQIAVKVMPGLPPAPRPAAPIAPAPTPTPPRAAFTPAKTVEEAQKYADRFVATYKGYHSGEVDYAGIDVKYANGMNQALTEVLDVYAPKYPIRNIKPFNMREKRFKGTTAEAAYQWGSADLFFNKGYYKTEKTLAAHVKEAEDLLKVVRENIVGLLDKYRDDTSRGGQMQFRYLTALQNTGRTNVSPPDAYGSTIHELGHYLDDQMFGSMMKEAGFDLAASFDKYATGISAYATQDRHEYVAESFTAYWFGEHDRLDPELVNIFRRAQK